MVFRCYVEKREGFDGDAKALTHDFKGFLGLSTLASLRLFHRYDIEGIDEGTYRTAQSVVLSEPVCDNLYEDVLPPLPKNTRLLMVEALPGQYDQRADSCAQCIQMIAGGERPVVRTARVLAVDGLTDAQFARLSDYVINPVESGPAAADKPETLHQRFEAPDAVALLTDFVTLDASGLAELHSRLGLAMDLSDLAFFQSHFRQESRDPTITELRVVDTYWSDHCRHTTFHTHLNDVDIQDVRVKRAFDAYLSARRDLYGECADARPVTLMDIATCGMKWLRRQGRLPGLDESDEINACTVRVRVDVSGRPEDWLLLFKNETHNHPTEIEPFGGAATCIGGAIRDPLSGRSYVYQGMRITGSGDPRAPLSATRPGKLPQRKLTTTAAAGFSSYGNQIGLATGLVREHYHPGYTAKRMELGAVVGAAPATSVVREMPQPGDVVILLGGRTGRDGIGGATGSSKSHDTQSVSACAAEVQKGNAPEERKLQRLFRNPEVTRLIRRCNDFGAGGVAVAIGELADGLVIQLDRVPKKYEGLDGTELAISESQERMAVVVAAEDAERLCQAAMNENLEATVVADVTAEPRLVMRWNGQTIVDLSRAFLSTNGAPKSAAALVPPAPAAPRVSPVKGSDDMATRLLLLISDLNLCSQKGLVERFDNTIGASTVFMPHGGHHHLTPTQVMAALMPVPHGTTETASVMSYAFDPFLSSHDPFDGARSAVVESVARLVAAGCSRQETYLTLQEYFPRLRDDAARWGLPLSALLGAFEAQCGLGIAAIGGKDSMSGSFLDLDVPPTLVSFSITTESAGALFSPEWKGAGHSVCLLPAPVDRDGQPDYAALLSRWDAFHALSRQGAVLSAMATGRGGAAGAVMLMALGNQIGFEAAKQSDSFDWFSPPVGSLVFEFDGPCPLPEAILLGHTQDSHTMTFGKTIVPLASLRAAWESPLESVFPTRFDAPSTPVPALTHSVRAPKPVRGADVAEPRAVIPVFPGTNCEYDTARFLERAGARPEILVVRNLTPDVLSESAQAMAQALNRSQMLVIPGGFSAGDEPDGSGKFISAFFRHPRLTEALRAMLARDGLILGICNGFQALIKLGLVPFGDILPPEQLDATLTFNTVGRYQSRYVHTRVASVLSPWLSRCAPGDLHVIPMAHGEGRLVASDARLATMATQGQVAFQYCDASGRPSMDDSVNPNGSACAIEGISSPDGRVLGKMGHTERAGLHIAKNIPGEKFQPLFEGGVDYFR